MCLIIAKLFWFITFRIIETIGVNEVFELLSRGLRQIFDRATSDEQINKYIYIGCVIKNPRIFFI